MRKEVENFEAVRDADNYSSNMFYNSTAWAYVVGYTVIALLGNLIALALR